MENIILSTTNLTKSYKNVRAVNNVNITIRKGDIYGFVGRNGSGKTTIIRLVTSIIMPDEGTFILFPNENNKKNLISAIVENPALYQNMNAYENIKMQCILKEIKDYSIIEPLLKQVELPYAKNDKKKAKNFSLGMRQRLAIAMALVGDPKLLILDEPTNGLDPEGIKEIRELLIKLNKERDITIMISSHILGELEKVATRFGFINEGNLIKEITAEELEHSLKHRLYLKIDDSKKALDVLAKEKIDNYRLINETTIEVSEPFDISNIVLKVAEAKVKILDIKSHNEDLESYFFNLLGGIQNV